MGKVALITGGASGMGLAVAQHLAATKKDWKFVLLDNKEEAGAAAAASIPGAVFMKVDVSSWESLSGAFDAAFDKFGGLDFVCANAGIFEHGSFYEDHAAAVSSANSRVPPPPNMFSIDVNLKGLIMTSYLAQHYFRLSPHKGKNAVLVMTASVCSLYPSPFIPIYAATKAGVVNFMRSIAFPFHDTDGIRVYATCPGSVRTSFLSDEGWGEFPEGYFTPMETVTETVAMLVEGGDMTDAWGRKVAAGEDFGLAVEINGKNFYFRDQPEFCDDVMKSIMGRTSAINNARK